MRTQRRVAREKEKQELVRQGLLEPPAPKVGGWACWGASGAGW